MHISLAKRDSNFIFLGSRGCAASRRESVRAYSSREPAREFRIRSAGARALDPRGNIVYKTNSRLFF
jgi:hypothetical protein